ncbi:MAG TPA: undecaprenyl-diphosphate phosphatase [Terriglobales bacterium]|nr:undecaprenyl-diphosphate phosphatase [Terriglobales bacterium]
MNDYLLSILLGIVEGLTEFLPVSSTAHLRITEALFGVDLTSGYWKMYTIVIQLGAILCLPIYFRKRIAAFLKTFPNGESGQGSALSHPLTLTLVAFVFTAVPSFLLSKVIGEHLESLVVMGTSLIVGGIVMWMIDIAYGRPGHAPLLPLARAASSSNFATEKLEEMTLMQAIWIGACQTLAAVFPGTSRSMATIAAGQLAGMSRPAALEFSFFLSIPTMAAATTYDLLKALRHAPGEPSPLGSLPMDVHHWTILGIGFMVSFVVAYGVVAWFMNWVQKHGFVPFAIYRIVLGIAVLAWALKSS